MKIDVSREGITSDVRKIFMYVVQSKLTFRGHAWLNIMVMLSVHSGSALWMCCICWLAIVTGCIPMLDTLTIHAGYDQWLWWFTLG